MSQEPLLGANRFRSPTRPLQTAFHEDALKMREKLNAVSPSLCLAKWLQVSLHLTNGRGHSCYHPLTHQIPREEIAKDPSALHNTNYKREQRRTMLSGRRPAECNVCWSIEDTPGDHLSDRSYRSAETWAAPNFDEVLKAGADGKINPRAVEVNFNHACQLKCSYCSPHLSSTWMEEIEKHGSYRLAEGAHNDLSYFKSEGMIPLKQSEANPYAEAFWKWWPDLYKDLKVFRMTGGEPLMDINTYRVLDYILEHPKPDLTLAITSNFSARDEFMNKFMSRIAKVANGRYVGKFQLYLSCDAFGARAEYQRFGLQFDRFVRNVDRFLTEVPTASINFITTYNNLSVTSWDEWLEQILALRRKHSRYQQRVFFDTPLLRYPGWQSVQILPPSYQKRIEGSIAKMRALGASFETIESRYHRVLDFETARMERNLAWMRQGLPDDEVRKQRANFYLFFKEHDRRRGTDFLKTFPEMGDFWALCESNAKLWRPEMFA